METAVGFGNIMPKPNFKTHITIIKVYLLPPNYFLLHFLTGEKNTEKRHWTRCFFFTHCIVKLFETGQSTFRSSTYLSSNLKNMSANHIRYI